MAANRDQYNQITVLTAAVGLGQGLAGNVPPDWAKSAVVVAEGQPVRWRDDGTDPAATIGMPLAVGVALVVDNFSLRNIKFIEQSASAKLNVTFYPR